MWDEHLHVGDIFLLPFYFVSSFLYLSYYDRGRSMKELLPTTLRSNSVNNENWAVELSNKSISSYAK